jgi:hypothetical protein
MRQSINRRSSKLPRRLPVGSTYVIEGYGGENGALRVTSRYLVLPGGRRIDVSTASSRSPALLRRTRNRWRIQAKRACPGHRKKS